MDRMENSQNASEIKQTKRSLEIRIIAAVMLMAAVAAIGTLTKGEDGFGTVFEITASAESESEDTTEADPANTESEDVTLSYELVKSSSPAEFVENYYKYYFYTGEFEKFWDDCVSQTTKDTGIYLNKEEYASNLRENLSSDHIDYDTIEISSVEDLGEGITAVNYKFIYTVDDDFLHEECTDYLIEENGEYKYLLDGIKSIQRCSVQTDSLLTMDCQEIYTYVDRLDLNFILNNDTGDNVYIGLVNGAAVTITMKDGTSYTEQLTGCVSIDSESIEIFSCPFNDVAGEITSIIIEPVYMVDMLGLLNTASEYCATYAVISDD